MGLLLTSRRCGRCLVVNVCGNVGADTAGLLHTGLRTALDSELLLIAVNLAEAVLADASALEVLSAIHRRAALASKVFLVVAPDPEAHETMRVTGLDRSLLVFPTVADFNAWNGDPGTYSDGGGVPHMRISPSRCASRDAAARGSPAGASIMPSKAT
jgi:anti-anti-sigma regulatory factor